jgi:hypothetical protein
MHQIQIEVKTLRRLFGLNVLKIANRVVTSRSDTPDFAIPPAVGTEGDSAVNVKTDHFESEPPFGPYDDAVDAFKQFAGGPMCEVTVIRSPRRVLNQFKHNFPTKTVHELRFRGIPVKLAKDQNIVSVRGKNSSGYECEWPDLE